jgi:hypothetical protein
MLTVAADEKNDEVKGSNGTDASNTSVRPDPVVHDCVPILASQYLIVSHFPDENAIKKINKQKRMKRVVLKMFAFPPSSPLVRKTCQRKR